MGVRVAEERSSEEKGARVMKEKVEEKIGDMGKLEREWDF